MRGRYYSSELRRFITEAPAKDGVNWYAYCGNNPIMYVDPWGFNGITTQKDAQAFASMLEAMGDITVIQTPFVDENGTEWVDLEVGTIYSTDKHVGQTLALSILRKGRTTYLFNQSYYISEGNSEPFMFLENYDGKTCIFFDIEESKRRAEESVEGDMIYKHQYASLGHEMLHAYHYYNGTFNADIVVPAKIDGEDNFLEEYKTLGVNCKDKYNNYINYHDSYIGMMCENGIRLENGLPLREKLGAK